MNPSTRSIDDIYVDTRDEVAVAKMLACVAPTVTVSSVDRDARLGLARWRLPDVAAALAANGERRPSCPFGDPPRDLIDLDGLIDAIRSHAALHYQRWYPVIDRNHDLFEVGTNPHVKVAANDPEPAASPTRPITATRPDGPRVGIADAQVYAHTELAGHVLGEPLTGAEPFLSAGPGHATFVAGTVLRRAPSATVVCGTVLRSGGPNFSWDVAVRLMQFLDEDIDVLNMSFGCETGTAPPLPLRRAMDRLGGRAVLVAAAGNHQDARDGHAAPLYPAAFGDVVAAGAADANGAIASMTPDVPWLDLLAPGEDVIGPFLPGLVWLHPDWDPAPDPVSFPYAYAKWSGSSFAAAAVTGEIARRMQTQRIDAFTARDELLAETVGDVLPFHFTGTGTGVAGATAGSSPS